MYRLIRQLISEISIRNLIGQNNEFILEPDITLERYKAQDKIINDILIKLKIKSKL
jgi:hypothetical protein